MAWSLRKALGFEYRDSPNNINTSATASEVFAFFGIDSRNLPAVTPMNAMRVPAYAAGRTFLSSSMANLPRHVYRNVNDTPQRVSGALQRILNEAPNAEWGSYGAWKYFWSGVFGERGRGLMWIERGPRDAIALWPMDPTKTTLRRVGVNKVYDWNDIGVQRTFSAADVIDVPFLLCADQISSHTTLQIGERAIQLALSMNDYGSGFFAGGGVPPLALAGPMPTGADAMKRALADIGRSIDSAKQDQKPIVAIPPGYELKPIGIDPEKGQMTDARRFQVEEIARVFNLPPVFLQDLTHGTFSNTEQQDLHLVKHLIAQWARALEDELNLKLFGAENNRRYVEHNLDGLMRGDLLARMQAMGQAVQNGLLAPNEGRALDNRPPKDGGDVLLIQGATIPLQNAGKQSMGTPPPADGGTQ